MASVREISLNSDFAKLRREIPALHQEVNGHPLAFLDNAASAQCPRSVIDAVSAHRSHDHANVHRGVHALSERSTRAYEGARDKLQHFIGAAHREEIIFTRGTTEAINLIAFSYGAKILRAGDEVLVSGMEHHSNIVPWQMICERTGAKLIPVPINCRGELEHEAFERLLSDRTRIVAVTHISNALGTINDVKKLVTLAHDAGAIVVVDGAQAAPHLPIDVQDINCDFYALSGHKMFGPTGIGALYGRLELLDAMPPWQGGGEMILTVTFEGSTYNDLPYKFEAGTPNITGAIGLGAAIDFMNGIDRDAMLAHETDLLQYATSQIESISGARIIGTAANKASVVSFVIDGIHAHDLGTVVDQSGVAIRTGHHCAMPVMDYFQVPATARASFAFYNNRSDVDHLLVGLAEAKKLFG